MNTKLTRILFLITTIIILGFSGVNAHPLTWSDSIEMDEGTKAIPQSEQISAPGMVSASDGDHDDFIRITWDSVLEASYYIIYVSDDENDSNPIDLGDVYGTSYDDSYVNGGTYY